MSPKSSRSIVVAVFFVTVLLLTVEASPFNSDATSELLEEGSPFQIDCHIPTARNSVVSFVKTHKGKSYSITNDLLNLYADRNASIVYDKWTKTYSFKIGSVTRSDIGLYSCELLQLAEKTADCVKLVTLSQIDLNVLCPPEITNISISANFVHEGTPVTLECIASGYPEPIVFWKREGNEVISGVGVTKYPKKVLKILPALKKDSGVYECVAENSLGVAANKSVKLTVFAKKQLTTEKYDVTENIYDDEE